MKNELLIACVPPHRKDREVMENDNFPITSTLSLLLFKIGHALTENRRRQQQQQQQQQPTHCAVTFATS
jgi:hypothetical protein